MRKVGEAFVGIDTAKARNTVTIAESGRQGEMRYLGELDTNPDAVAKLVRRLSGRYEMLHFCVDGPRVHRGGPVDDPAETGRSDKDKPSGFADVGTLAPCRRTHRRVGAG